MTGGFVPLAVRAGGHIVTNPLVHAWPVEVAADKFFGLVLAEVPSNLRVVFGAGDQELECIVVGNMESAFVEDQLALSLIRSRGLVSDPAIFVVGFRCC